MKTKLLRNRSPHLYLYGTTPPLRMKRKSKSRELRWHLKTLRVFSINANVCSLALLASCANVRPYSRVRRASLKMVINGRFLRPSEASTFVYRWLGLQSLLARKWMADLPHETVLDANTGELGVAPDAHEEDVASCAEGLLQRRGLMRKVPAVAEHLARGHGGGRGVAWMVAGESERGAVTWYALSLWSRPSSSSSSILFCIPSTHRPRSQITCCQPFALPT